MSSHPLVSVVLPCYEAAAVVADALHSMLEQTYSELEIVAIDDGSTDATTQILRDFARRDGRIRVLSNTTNQGLVRTLNRGVGESSGQFIARMDADDIAMPQRIERQLATFMSRPRVGVVGSAVRSVSLDGRRLRPRPVRWTEPDGARFMALLGTPVVHPTLMARAEVMKAHPYSVEPESMHTEDYELFSRLLSDGVEFVNLETPLLFHRVDPRGVSLRHEQAQVSNFLICARKHLERTLQLSPPPRIHRVLVNRIDPGLTPDELDGGLQLLDRVEEGFLRLTPQAGPEVRRIADLQRVDIFIQAGKHGGVPVLAAATRLGVRYGRRLLSPRARRYALTKASPALDPLRWTRTS